MSKKLATVAPQTDAPRGDEDRFARGLGTQKERTLNEEKAAWNRRLRRWKRKNLEKLGEDGVRMAFEAVLPLVLTDLSKDEKGLRFLKFKAIHAIGQDNIDAAIKAVMGSKE